MGSIGGFVRRISARADPRRSWVGHPLGQSVDQSLYYKLSTQFRGEGLKLDSSENFETHDHA
jgi:hypothetical protein